MPHAANDDITSQSDVVDFEGSITPSARTADEYHADWVDVLDTIGNAETYWTILKFSC